MNGLPHFAPKRDLHPQELSENKVIGTHAVMGKGHEMPPLVLRMACLLNALPSTGSGAPACSSGSPLNTISRSAEPRAPRALRS